VTRRALITGITGQDGAYLAQLLLKIGYEVVGAQRHGSQDNTQRLRALGIAGEVHMVGFDIMEDASVRNVVERVKPDEIYNLAAQSSIAYGIECPQYTADANGNGVLRLLEAIRLVNPKIRFFQASSSEMFGDVRTSPQTEETEFRPRSPYGTAKLFAHWVTKNYREIHGLHASTGIMFNHTSPLQSAGFVARKITSGMVALARGKSSRLELGNLDARRDWGFAGDYVKGMWQMVQQPLGGDYVLATGATHSVQDFVNLTSECLGYPLQWDGVGQSECARNVKGEVVISVNPAFYRPAETQLLCGDASKAHRMLSWVPIVSLTELIALMVANEA
jgi:GDPmannose 4,6-dehydratase